MNYLSTPAHRAGITLVSATTLFHILGFLGGGWWWLLIAFMGYCVPALFVHFPFRKKPVIIDGMAHPTPTPEKNFNLFIETLAEQHLSGDIIASLAKLRQTLASVLEQQEKLAPASEDRYLIGAIANDYIPATIQAYLQVPRENINKPLEGNLSAHDICLEQLNMLQERLERIAEATGQGDAHALLANRRFLKARFGASPQLNLPPPTDGA